jgi:hypothetical protein
VTDCPYLYTLVWPGGLFPVHGRLQGCWAGSLVREFVSGSVIVPHCCCFPTTGADQVNGVVTQQASQQAVCVSVCQQEQTSN